NNAGTETQSTAVAPGGRIPLSPSTCTMHTPSTMTTNGIRIDGESPGEQIDPNGEAEGVTGTKLKCDQALANCSTFTLGAAGRVNGMLEKMFLWGIGRTPLTQANSAINFANQTDQFHLQDLNIANFGN